jgi:hypothetical protein
LPEFPQNKKLINLYWVLQDSLTAREDNDLCVIAAVRSVDQWIEQQDSEKSYFS